MSQKVINEEIPFQESTIETIDFSVFDFVDKKMNIFTTTNRGFIKVPVIWASAERSYMSKRNKEFRDGTGNNMSLIFPLISIERVSMIKDPARKGTAYANIPAVGDEKGGSITIARRIKHDKTSNFANVDSKKFRGQYNFPRKNEKIVYETISIPMPVYVDVAYKIKIKTNFQQQMNEIMQPFITKTGGINYFIAKRDGHRYEGFIQQDFVNNSNVGNMQSEERMYETEIDIKILGYLIGLGKNQEKPKIVKRENAVEVKISREKVIFGDIPEHTNTGQTYIGINSISPGITSGSR